MTGYDPVGSGRAQTGAAAAEPRIRMARPDLGATELAAVQEVFASGYLTNGPATRRFEEAMAARHGTEHAVAFANGTVALSAMYIASGIGPGDEVIVPSFTFISTATSVLHVGATPVFADIEPETYCLDPADVAGKVTSRTKAIVPVHYAGQAADLAPLAEIADDADADLLEDAAEAHGASYRDRPVGSWGRAAMFSFTPTKNITTGEGGIVTTDDEGYADRLRRLRNHGMSALYVHDELGFNWRLSDIQSAIGCCQVDRLDDIVATKRAIAARLDALLADVPGVGTPTVRPDRDHTYMMYTVRLDGRRRDAVRDALAAAGIETRVYFPPAHRQAVFGAVEVDLPVTDAVAASVLSLPIHARLTADEVEDVASALIAAVR